MKKIIYIFLFALLGVLAQFILRGVLEIWYIGLLLEDFSRFGLGLSWDAWVMIHNVGTVLLFAVGVCIGFRQGKFWWKKIYERSGFKA